MKTKKIILFILLIILFFIFIYFSFVQNIYYRNKIKKDIINNNLNNIIISYYTNNTLINKSYIQDNLILSVDYYENLPSYQFLIDNNTNKKYEYYSNESNSIKESFIEKKSYININNNLISNLNDNNQKFIYIKTLKSKNCIIFKLINKKANLITYYFYNTENNLIEKEILYSLDTHKINIYEYTTEFLINIYDIIPEFIITYKN